MHVALLANVQICMSASARELARNPSYTFGLTAAYESTHRHLLQHSVGGVGVGAVESEFITPPVGIFCGDWGFGFGF